MSKHSKVQALLSAIREEKEIISLCLSLLTDSHLPVSVAEEGLRDIETAKIRIEVCRRSLVNLGYSLEA